MLPSSRRTLAEILGSGYYRVLLALAAVLLPVFLAGRVTRDLVSARSNPFAASDISRDYANQGEMLIHGIRSQEAPDRLPLATVAAALHYHHSGFSWTPTVVLVPCLLAVLIVAVGVLLHSTTCGLLALALWGAYAHQTLLAHAYPNGGFTALIVILAGLLVLRARNPSPRLTALLALSLGATLLYRSTLAFFPPLLAILEWRARPGSPPRSLWKRLLILGAAPYLILIPWIAMNASLQAKLIPFERGGASSNITSGALGLVNNIEGAWQALIDDPAVDPKNDRAVVGWAARQVLRRPGRYLSALGHRLAFVFSLAPHLWLLAAAAFAVYRRRPEITQVAILSLYFAGIYCLMTVEPLYFYPLWPLLALLSAVLLSRPLTGAAEENALSRRLAAAALLGALALLTVLSLYTGWKTARFSAGGKHQAGQHLPAADERLLAQIRSNPGDAWLLGERGWRRLEEGDAGGAAEDFTAALAQRPYPEWKLQLAVARLHQGNSSPLLRWRYLEDSSNRDANELNLEAQICVALAYLHLNRISEAREQLKAAHHKYLGNITIRTDRDTENERLVLQALRASRSKLAERVMHRLKIMPQSARLTRMTKALLAEAAPEDAKRR